MIKKWETANGNLIKISEMSDCHLLNTIYLLERTAPKIYEMNLQSAMQLSCYVTGEMASYTIEQEIDRMMEEDPYEPTHYKYDWLVDEAIERGLLPEFYCYSDKEKPKVRRTAKDAARDFEVWRG